MKYSIQLLSLFLLGSSLIADTNSVHIGESVSTALIQKLGSELKTQMINNGPVAALGFCNASAQNLTQEISVSSHYNIKRVSLLDRNPKNRANAQEAAILNGWQETLNASKPLPAYEIRSAGNVDYYYKPLVINNEMCLKCHGNIDMQSELGLAIKAAYPTDRAIGYKMGDLRGMIVVDIPVEH